MNKKRYKKGTVGRLIRTMVQFYPVLIPLTVMFILFNAVISSIPTMFMQRVIAVIETTWKTGDWAAAKGPILKYVGTLVSLYIFSLASGLTFHLLMATITQGTLKKLRVRLFDNMQELPISYFDQHQHGDLAVACGLRQTHQS